ncbi:MAG: hypothetical protein WC346_16515 [Methanogenium sp.]|jgi:hypothetical protein
MQLTNATKIRIGIVFEGRTKETAEGLAATQELLDYLKLKYDILGLKKEVKDTLNGIQIITKSWLEKGEYQNTIQKILKALQPYINFVYTDILQEKYTTKTNKIARDFIVYILIFKFGYSRTEVGSIFNKSEVLIRRILRRFDTTDTGLCKDVELKDIYNFVNTRYKNEC